MRLIMVINWFITVVLISLGAFLGGSLESPLQFAFIVTLIVFAVIIQYLLTSLQGKENDLIQERAKVSALLIKKGDMGLLQCGFFLRNYGVRIKKSHFYTLDIIINSQIQLQNNLEIRLVTDREWNVRANDQLIISGVFAGKFEYILNSQSETIENKHFRLSVEVEFLTDGLHTFIIETKNQQLEQKFSGSISVTT